MAAASFFEGGGGSVVPCANARVAKESEAIRISRWTIVWATDMILHKLIYSKNEETSMWSRNQAVARSAESHLLALLNGLAPNCKRVVPRGRVGRFLAIDAAQLTEKPACKIRSFLKSGGVMVHQLYVADCTFLLRFFVAYCYYLGRARLRSGGVAVKALLNESRGQLRR